MKTPLTFKIVNESGKEVKSLKAAGMNSIYTQYKRYCIGKSAINYVECPNEESFGLLYWKNDTDNFYLIRTAN